jgi:hypothetical protein
MMGLGLWAQYFFVKMISPREAKKPKRNLISSHTEYVQVPLPSFFDKRDV